MELSRLENSRVVATIKALLRSKHPWILFLMATVHEMKIFKCKISFCNCLVVTSIGRAGGLAMLWMNDV